MSTQDSSKKIDLLAFINRPRETNKKRSINERRKDFDEIYITQQKPELSQQAERCLDCGNPYCEWKCPLHNYIPNWLALVRDEQFEQAAKLMHETNPLPEICGRVCPQDRLCEQACTINTGFGAVAIGAIEKNIADRALAQNWRPDLTQIEQTGKQVAIVGAGPAGLGCAELLVRNGVKAVVFDQYPEIGGLLTFGIPGFKLEKDVVVRRRLFLEDLGVEFRLNTRVGEQISTATLQADFDAIFLATGCYSSVDGNLPGRNSEGVINALDYLIGNINQQQNYQLKDFPFTDLNGKQVVVLGGGDTAMDCVRSAVRQQAASVTCVYRRDRESMPGSAQEIVNAIEEGVEFEFNRQPLSIVEKSGKVQGVKLAETQLKQDADDGRKTFIVNENKTQLINADVVILAFGFKPSPASWLEDLGVTLDEYGLVKTLSAAKATPEPTEYAQRTESEGVYAGGDMVRGADLVVTAIAEGRQAAREIMDYLEV